MKDRKAEILWPDGSISFSNCGENWLIAAHKADIEIPTGCLGGSCGACEIEANGEIFRACINQVPDTSSIKVVFAEDPYW